MPWHALILAVIRLRLGVLSGDDLMAGEHRQDVVT
jgi:hypothetical protein